MVVFRVSLFRVTRSPTPSAVRQVPPAWPGASDFTRRPIRYAEPPLPRKYSLRRSTTMERHGPRRVGQAQTAAGQQQFYFFRVFFGCSWVFIRTAYSGDSHTVRRWFTPSRTGSLAQLYVESTESRGAVEPPELTMGPPAPSLSVLGDKPLAARVRSIDIISSRGIRGVVPAVLYLVRMTRALACCRVSFFPHFAFSLRLESSERQDRGEQSGRKQRRCQVLSAWLVLCDTIVCTRD